MGSNSKPPPDYFANNPNQAVFGAMWGAPGAQEALQSQQADFNKLHQGGNKKAAPPPPDYQGLAQQQAQQSGANVRTQTQANRPNVNTPFGNQQWTMGPDGTWTLNSSLGGPLGGAAASLGSEAARNFSTPMDTGTGARDQAIDAAFKQAMSRLGPQFDQAGASLDQSLSNQGLDPGSEAGRNALNTFGRNKNDAISQALFGAIGQGTAAQQATFNENLAARMAPLGALQGLQGLTQTPNFMGAGVAETPQLLPAGIAQGNYGLQNQQQQNQILGDALGSFFGLGGSAASFFKK